MTISPYSLSHEWNLHWTRIPSNVRASDYINGESPKERKALEALAAVGTIEGAQLFRLFSLDKKRLKRMVLEKKIVRHELIRNKQVIPIFTLGINGAVIGGLKDSYDSNYWVEYKIEDVLKRLLFFRLFQHFPESQILPTQEPFLGAIQFMDNPIYVYVVRGNMSDLLMFLKWRGEQHNERFIIITESFHHLRPLVMINKKLKLRIALDFDLQNETVSIQDIFYLFNGSGNFVSEMKVND